MTKPSTMQYKVYEYLCQQFTQEQKLPNLSDVARYFGITFVTLKQHLQALDKKGYLSYESRGRGRSPQVELIKFGIPLLGNITAGSLEERFESPEGYLALQGYIGKDTFALQIEGNSMADFIQDKDIVILKASKPQRSGEICAVRVGGETTLKYLDWSNKLKKDISKTVTLRPHNPEYPTQKITNQELEVDGVFIGLLRGEFTKFFINN